MRVLAFVGALCTATAAFAQNGVSALTVAGLSPAFAAGTLQYTAPLPASGCGIAVTVTLTQATDLLYIQSNPVKSGVTLNAYVCGGKKIDITIYRNWKVIGSYVITPVAAPVVPPPPPPPALTALTIASLSPAFDPATTTYSIPRTAACSVPVTATLTDSTNKLYVQNGLTASGATANAWVCDGKTKIDIVVYKVWTEVGRYTVNLVGEAPPPSMGGGGSTGSGGGTPYVPPPTGPTEIYPTPAPAPVYTEPQPFPTAIDIQSAARLLRQGAFGPTTAELQTAMAQGPNLWIWNQIKKPSSTIADGIDVNAVRATVFNNMATGADQLRQRVAFALSQIIVTSTNKNINGGEMIPWVRLLNTHAFGNYRTLLREVTLSPTMGKYLDLANSIGGLANSAPNENYPRELMQLFTIGIYQLNQDGSRKLDAQGQPIPTYTQAGVREMARTLSGWTYPDVPGQAYRSTNNENFTGLMVPRPENHDKGSKTLFGTTIPAGQSVTKDMDDALDILFNHPNTAPFVATRLIRSLVTSNPSPAFITRIANVFDDNGHGVRGDLAAVVTAILTDADAALPGVNDGHLIDPILNTITLGRSLDATFGDAGQFMYVLTNLGQAVLTSPSVFNFYSPLAPLPGAPGMFGPEFAIYSPGVAIQRANFTYGLLTNQFASGINFNLGAFVAAAGNANTLVDLVNQKLFQGRMSNELRGVLVATALATSDPTNRAVGTVYLAAISSEFLVHAQ